MSALLELGSKELTALLFVALGVFLIFYDLRAILRELNANKPENSALIVKGIRVFTTSLAIALLSFAILYNNDTLLLFGLIFGIEELYETTLVITALKYSNS